MKRSPALAVLGLGTAVAVLAGISLVGTAGADERSGRIGNRTFVDTNGNGVRDAGEPGLAGVTILLSDLAGNALIKGTSAEGGWWGIADLDTTKCYRLSFDGPNGYAPTVFGGHEADNASSQNEDGIVDADICPTAATQDFWDAGFVAVGDGEGPEVTVPPTTASPETTVPETPPTTAPLPATGTGKIGNRVFLDENRNGLLDPGEKGVEGVQIRLSNPDGLARIVGKTAAGGWWGIGNLPDACYFLAFSVPVGYEVTEATELPAPGQIGSAVAPDGSFPASLCTDGTTKNTYNMGIAPDPEAPEDPGPTGHGTLLVRPTWEGRGLSGAVTVTNKAGTYPAGAITRSWFSIDGVYHATNLPTDVECYDVTISRGWPDQQQLTREFCGTGAHRTALFPVTSL